MEILLPTSLSFWSSLLISVWQTDLLFADCLIYSSSWAVISALLDSGVYYVLRAEFFQIHKWAAKYTAWLAASKQQCSVGNSLYCWVLDS